VNPIQRIVFDTSTLVGAALRIGSVPHQSLLKALSVCIVCASAETLAEIEEVLNRSKFDRYLNRDERQEFIGNLRRRVRLFVMQDAGTMTIDPPCRDPRDNQFLVLALAAEADALVSSDADLLVLHPWRGIPIVTPAEFLARLPEPPAG
jgi:putative PIN family toxin of toxin-antitoxin system